MSLSIAVSNFTQGGWPVLDLGTFGNVSFRCFLVKLSIAVRALDHIV